MSALQSLSLVGGVVPPSLVARIQAGEVSDRQSLSSTSYHLVGTETVRDAASRAWGYLRGAWESWSEHAKQGGAPGARTGAARERWLLPLLRELGYGQVPALSGGLHVDGVDYPVSHLWQHVPIHLLGPGVDLDRRNPGVAGAARAPQSMVQELLNRSDDHLWALVSNGSRLRLLRDSTSLAGSAYVEFDLEAIFDGELYAEWLLLFQLCHVSRLEVRGEGEVGPADCWLESWRNEAVDAGGRALDKLRVGVEDALTTLGSGFLAHPDNRWLLAGLRSGELSDREFHRALLRLVYRLLFCFVAEDRDALLLPGEEHREGRERYERFFSTARLRQLSRVRMGSAHTDLWQAQRLILAGLGGEGIEALAIPALGGLFDPDRRAVIPAGSPTDRELLRGASLANSELLRAIRSLAWVADQRGRTQRVDYRNLGAEELGSVYESLLELIPRVDPDQRAFRLEHAAGNERKTTGSYYTPPGLVSALLDTTLDPVIDDAVRGVSSAAEAERHLLGLTVCDPACGSGGFLVAAARRIARRLAQWRSGEDEPTPEQVRHAMRDVVGRCVYGVDINDLAAELAKVSLWLEALEPGKPLGFLDARVRVGNALLGTTPALLRDGVPDVAFKELLGDDKSYASQIRKRNKVEAPGQDFLFGEAPVSTAELVERRQVLLDQRDDIAGRRAQEEAWAAYEDSVGLRHRRLHANAWCAAFVWPLHHDSALPPTSAVVRQIEHDREARGLAATVREIDRLTEEYGFFHWHLEFPEVFGDTTAADSGPEGWPGGFSCLLGNPPWERVKLQEQEFFAARDPEIAKAPNAAKRRKLIAALEYEDPQLYAAFEAAKRSAEGQSALLRTSGRFPLNGRGDVNTYAVFTELSRTLTGPTGSSGIIVPIGIATDATTQYFFSDVVQSRQLRAVIGFYDRKQIFKNADVHGFCLFVVAGRDRHVDRADFSFFLRALEDLHSVERRYSLSPEEIMMLNPNTGTAPVFRTRRDAEITLGIYRRVPVLIKEGDPDGNPWGISFMTMFHMSNDSHLFHTREELEADGWTLDGNIFVKEAPPHIPGKQVRMLPLLEAKMMHHYDTRWATYEPDGSTRNLTLAEKADDQVHPMPRYWVHEGEVERKLDGKWDKGWMLGWRDICRATDARTVISTEGPRVAYPDKWLVARPQRGRQEIQAVWSSFAFDFAARQKIGGTSMKYFTFMQLPMPTPDQVAACPVPLDVPAMDWIGTRVDRLNARPTPHNEGERAVWRSELDALACHLYGLEREDVDYILETFPIVKRQDLAVYDEFRTKRLILAAYDAMTESIRDGNTYAALSVESA